MDSDILENFSRNGGYVVLARSHSIIKACFCGVIGGTSLARGTLTLLSVFFKEAEIFLIALCQSSSLAARDFVCSKAAKKHQLNTHTFKNEKLPPSINAV